MEDVSKEMETERLDGVSNEMKTVRWGVFIPMFLLVSSTAILGIFHSEDLISLTKLFLIGLYKILVGYIKLLPWSH